LGNFLKNSSGKKSAAQRANLPKADLLKVSQGLKFTKIFVQYYIYAFVVDNKHNHCLLNSTIIRIAFITASKETPTSANVAIHMFAMPKTPKTMIISLTDKEKIMFCQTIMRVFFALRTDVTILEM
jgi:hypothetical protein